jgi:crossover junction endodeoxyribonuclease RusA
MTAIVIEFRRPSLLLNMNDRLHWSVQRRTAAAWRAAARVAAIQQIEPPVQLGPSLIELDLPVADGRRRDPHNYAPTLKHVVDGLVDAGLWPDDTPNWVRTLEPSLHVTPKNAEPTVRVSITPRSTE